MKTKTVTYSKLFSLGNFENEKIGVEIEIEPGDDVQQAIQSAKQYVEYNHKLNGIVTGIEECQHVINNPDDFTGRQVQNARERLYALQTEIEKGQKLLM